MLCPSRNQWSVCGHGCVTVVWGEWCLCVLEGALCSLSRHPPQADKGFINTVQDFRSPREAVYHQKREERLSRECEALTAYTNHTVKLVCVLRVLNVTCVSAHRSWVGHTAVSVCNLFKSCHREVIGPDSIIWSYLNWCPKGILGEQCKHSLNGCTKAIWMDYSQSKSDCWLIHWANE